MKKTLLGWVKKGDEILPGYIGIIVNNYKDPDPY